MTRSDSTHRTQGVAGWPVRVHQLGQNISDDLSETTTPEERLAMVWELTARAWMLTGAALPTYRRAETPVQVIRPA